MGSEAGTRWLRWSALAIAGVVAVLPSARVLGQSSWRGPDRVQVYLAVPADVQVNYGLSDAALHETDLAITWLQAQVGRQLRGGDVRFAEVVTLTVASSALVGDVHRAFEVIHAELTAHADDPDVFPVILADVRTETATTGVLTCGLGGVRGVVMFLGNCPGDELSTRSTWPSEASATIAHELVHGLGAADPCGTSATTDGHVADDPNDVIYSGPLPRDPTLPITLDAARDDYHAHDVTGCTDIADSPLWDG